MLREPEPSAATAESGKRLPMTTEYQPSDAAADSAWLAVSVCRTWASSAASGRDGAAAVNVDSGTTTLVTVLARTSGGTEAGPITGISTLGSLRARKSATVEVRSGRPVVGSGTISSAWKVSSAIHGMAGSAPSVRSHGSVRRFRVTEGSTFQ